MSRRNFKFAFTPVVLAMMMANACAQAAAPAAPAEAASAAADGATAASANPPALELQQVVITATRRFANLQQVPATVQSLSSNTLAELKLQAVSDLPALVPGLAAAQAATVVTFLRGVGINSAGFTTEAPVAIYVDGLYLPNPASGVFSFNNIERIEVLKGPQGTLYGRNSTAGLISIVTREPEKEPRLDISAGYESYNTTKLNFYGSTPIADDLFIGLSAVVSKQNKGWGNNIVTGNDVGKRYEQGAQLKLLWKPVTGTKVTITGFYDRNDSDQGLVNPIYPGTVAIDGTPSLGNYNTAVRRDPTGITEQAYVALKIEQDLGFANLLSLTGYQHAHQQQNFTQNGIPGKPVIGQSASEVNIFGDNKTFSQEFQLSSKPSDSPFDWIAGAFYFHDNTTLGLDSYGTCIGNVCAPAPFPTHTDAVPTTRSSSVYADGSYKLLEATRLTLGLRYTKDKKALTGLLRPLAGYPNSPTALPPTAVLHPGDPYPGNPNGIPTSVSFPKLTYRAVLAQDFTKDINGYVSYNRGFKSGAFNPTSFSNPVNKPEVLDSWEIGLKSQLFDRRLRLNASVFNYDYKDLQLRTTAPPAPPGGFLQTNAANATVRGVDIDF
ncbi:MAG: TonB-dependent receptor, partial [Rubrivivax sp.]